MNLPATTRRRSIRSALALAAAAAAWLGVSGCGGKPPEIRPPSAVAPQPAPVAEDPNAGSPQALATRAQKWAHEADSVMRTRVKPAPAEGSLADMLRPEDLTIGPSTIHPIHKEPVVMMAPIATPTVQATQSSANQADMIASAVPPAAAVAVPPATARTPAADKLLGDSGNPSATMGLSVAELSLDRHLKAYPKDTWAHLDYQLIQFIKDKQVPQMEPLAKLPLEDRELVSTILDGLTNVRQALRADNNMLMSRKVRPILDMADRLRAQADMTIPTIALCTRVDGFGVYEPITPARFTAMREHPVLVYCEVENFASHMNEKKLWETKLSQEVVLYTETGLPVWQDKTENIPDLARRRRHDFFIVKKTRFPSNITIGRYLLKVTVVDQQGNRVAEATHPVQFVGGN